MAAKRAGVVYSVCAYALWGLLPLYLKVLEAVPPVEILLHRVVWSAAFLSAILTARRGWGWVAPTARSPAVLGRGLASALLLTVNWFVFIWAVDAHRVIDASLGYFINPLVSVLLGVLLLRERLRPVQWAAVSLAAAGVAWLTVDAGRLPWIALVLAGSFGLYGLLRKTTVLGALEGLALETFLLLPAAGAWLVTMAVAGQSHFASGGFGARALLVLAGPATAVPLLLFAAGARRIPLSLLGLLQYVGPTLQLGLGIYVWGEPFSLRRLAGFALIWLALGVYSGEVWWRTARAAKQA